MEMNDHDDNQHKTPNKSSTYEYNMSCFQPPLPQMNGSASAKNRNQIKERLVSSSSRSNSNNAPCDVSNAAAASIGDHPQGFNGATAGDAAGDASAADNFFSPRSTAAMALSSISQQQQEQQQQEQLAECPHPSIKRNIHAGEDSSEQARPVSQCSAETQLTGNSSGRGRNNNDSGGNLSEPRRSTSPYPPQYNQEGPPPPPPPAHVPVSSAQNLNRSVNGNHVGNATPRSTSPYPNYANNDCPPPARSAAAAGVTPSPHAQQSASHMAYYTPSSEQQSDYYHGPPQYHHHSRHDSYQQQQQHHHQSDPYHQSHAYNHEQAYHQPSSSRHEQHSVRWWGSTSSCLSDHGGSMQPPESQLHSSGYSHNHQQNQNQHHHAHQSSGYHHSSHRSNAHAHHDSYHGHHSAPPPPPPPGNTHPRSSLGHPALGVGASSHGHRAPSSHRPHHHPSYDYYHQQQAHHHHGHSVQQTTHNPRVRSLSQSMMTPPTMQPPTKKTKVVAPDYSRKKKSLGVLAETFCSRHDGCRKETEIVVDILAKELGVERRRIYDVVNIFEAVRLVVKKGKNTYSWMGTDHLAHMFALLQQEAIFDYPQDAFDGEIIDTLPTKEEINVARLAFRDPKRDAKSLSRLSQQFLQVFLVANTGTCVSLIDASDKIQGGASTEQELAALGSQGRAIPDDPILIQKAAARGLKTKIRRLYDIANVFHAIGLLEKVDETEHKLASGNTLEGRRPFYRWAFKVSAKDLRSVYGNMTQEMKECRCPFSPEPLVVPIKMEQGQTPRGSYTSTYNNYNSRMLPPPPYSVQSKEDGVLPTPPRVLAHIHDIAEKKHQEDHDIVANSSYTSTTNTSNNMNDNSNSSSIRRVSLPMTTTSASPPGNCMAPPHTVTPPSGNHVHQHSSSISDETLGAPPIEDDPITLGGGGGGSNTYGASTQFNHHHHHHRVSLPETM